jgi:hypothetical protein
MSPIQASRTPLYLPRPNCGPTSSTLDWNQRTSYIQVADLERSREWQQSNHGGFRSILCRMCHLDWSVQHWPFVSGENLENGRHEPILPSPRSSLETAHSRTHAYWGCVGWTKRLSVIEAVSDMISREVKSPFVLGRACNDGFSTFPKHEAM